MMLTLLKVLVLAAVLGYSTAAIVGGRRTYINYNSKCGVWNDPTVRRGKVLEECCPIDATYAGNPWQQLSVSYRINNYLSQFSGNTGRGGCSSYTVLSEKVLDDGSGTVGIEHVFQMGVLQITKTETWEFDGKVVLISFKVKYPKGLKNCAPVTNLTIMHAVDPDQDWQPFNTFQTANDVMINGGLYAEAVGPRSCKTMGYGICLNRNQDRSTDEVGFTRWQSATPANIEDPGGMLRDDTMHYQHTEARELYGGDEREFRFFAVWGRCQAEARANFYAAHKKFCSRCVRPLPVERLPQPKCAGLCPCTARNANCTCSYRCPRGAPLTASDDSAVRTEAGRLATRCELVEILPELSAARVRAPEQVNIDAVTPTAQDCVILRTLRDSEVREPLLQVEVPITVPPRV